MNGTLSTHRSLEPSIKFLGHIWKKDTKFTCQYKTPSKPPNQLIPTSHNFPPRNSFFIFPPLPIRMLLILLVVLGVVVLIQLKVCGLCLGLPAKVAIRKILAQVLKFLVLLDTPLWYVKYLNSLKTNNTVRITTHT